MTEHDRNWIHEAATGEKRCICGAPWRYGGCPVQRAEEAKRPYGKLPRGTRIGIWVVAGGITAAVGALATAVARLLGLW